MAAPLPEDSTDIASLPPLRELIAAHRLAARKGLGQHFLLDLNLTARIARIAGRLEERTVIEVGPGPGGLTRAILRAGARRVIAIEKDLRCRGALASLEEAARGRLVLVEADALEVHEPELLTQVGVPLQGIMLISNLPYNVATVLLVKWMRQIAASPQLYERLVVTLQKEVAERLFARPRTKAYGRLSVLCQWLTEVEPCFEISPRAFTPPPKVTSTVVRMTPRPIPLAPAPWAEFEEVTRAAFGQRRKMLRTSLRAATPGAPTEPLIAAAGLAPTARAEELTVPAFAALARALAADKARQAQR